MGRFHVKINTNFKTALLLFIGVSVVIGTGQERAGTGDSNEEQSVRKFLQTMTEDRETRYVAVFRDLNGDGRPEALAYLVGNEWCGSGGCTLFILSKTGKSWNVMSRITITRPPVRVLDAVSNGWHCLGVQVSGGGIRRPYQAEIPFNGKKYASNPTVPPARRATKNAAGEVAIASFETAKPLFGE
jgi:hypothetical protein